MKKGSVNVNTSAIAWNEAKTVATIELSGKLLVGEYTVNVTGLSDDGLTGTATAGGSVVRANASALKGVATISVINTAKEGDSIVLTLIHESSGKSISQTVKVSSEATVSDISITGLYNKEGKKLTETTDLTKDTFYLVVEGKDQYQYQYGQASNLAALNSATIILNNTNPSGVSAKAGETTVTLIAPASGKNTTYTVKVYKLI